MLDQSRFRSTVQFADFLELLILGRGSQSISRHALHASMPSHWVVEDLHLSVGLREMSRRQEILTDRYPFSVEDGFVVHHGGGSLYKSMLSLSALHHVLGDSMENGSEGVAEVFEVVVERALSSFLGANTRVVNFGWPSRSGRPAEFPAAVSWLAHQMGIDAGVAYRNPRRKDGGVDLVVWKDFRDRRVGVPVVLCQVTIQRNFVPKSRDIDRRIWAGWLAMDTEPIVALCVPFVLEKNEEWFEVSRNALPLDRLRLCGECVDSSAISEDEETIIARVLARVADGTQ